MDTYRVNRYNITGPGIVSNRLVQGAYRYQKLNLSSTGSLTLKNVGASPTLHMKSLSDLPDSSNETLDQIWAVGAQTVQMTEIPEKSLPMYLKATANGAWAESVAPQVLGSAVAAQLLQYDLTPRSSLSSVVSDSPCFLIR